MRPHRFATRRSALVTVSCSIAIVGCDGPRPFTDAAVPMDVPPPLDVGADIRDVRPPPGDGARPDASAPASHTLPSGEVIAPDTQDDAPMRFGGPCDPTHVPNVLYPPDGAILPPNLYGLTILIDRPLGDDLFELTFAGATEAVRVYRACIHSGNPCTLPFDPVLYPLVVHAAAGDGTVHIRVRSTSTDGVSPVGSAGPITLGFTQQPIGGAIYYFNTTGARIARYDFDHPENPPEGYLGPTQCHGCHSLSHDGRRISALAQSSPSYAIRAYDVSTRTPRTYNLASSLNAISPDGARLVGSAGTMAENQGLALYDADTGSLLDQVLGFATVDTAAWAPDGTNVVFAAVRASDAGAAGPQQLFRTAIVGDRFAPVELLPFNAPGNVARPAFTWDGAWLVVNQGSDPGVPFGGATLWMVPSTGGTPVELARADIDGTGDARWPRFAPFAQTYQGEPLVWLSFSSPRRLYPDELMPMPQLFMCAVRPGRVARGEDPSAPAFWLPFQNRADGNHDAQWAEHVPPSQPCTVDTDCPDGLRCVRLSSLDRGVCLAP